jgi:bifunctional UDP-N-acetylglucosamine pyrophosphorylase/glucosamine-1-phosphate N-acetyltransferase
VKTPVRPDQQGKIAGLAVVVMAAGLGKRMRSKQTKVLHPVAGQAMVLYSVELGLSVAGDRVAVVVGHQAARCQEGAEALQLHSLSNGSN